MSSLVAAALCSSALARRRALATRLVVWPKSVISWLTAAPAAARVYTMGLFRAPAVMRLLLSASTAVRLAKVWGQRFDRTSRVTCREASALSRAAVITGLFLSAIASASFKESRRTLEDGWAR